MTNLSGKQKKRLRALGQKLDPAVHIGKGGLSEPVLQTADEALDRHELIKVRLPSQLGPPERKALAAELAESLRAVCPGLVGKVALLYRPNPELDISKRVDPGE